MKDLTYVNGSPVMTGYLKNRYLPSNKKNGYQLNDTNLKVLPGLDGKIQEGLYDETRILPKTTNELRPLNDPKETFKGMKIEAIKKGGLRGIDPNIEYRKPMTYRINKPDDLQKTSAITRAETVRDNFVLDKTNRSDSIYHSGPAKADGNKNMPDYQRPKIRESEKITLKDDSITRNLTGSVTVYYKIN